MNEIKIIAGLINNAYGRARRAWKNRDLKAFQHLAKLQTDMGADYLLLNIDGNQRLSVKPEEMLEFLPELVPAIQEVTPVPLCFDNPSADFHRVALEKYDFSKGGKPIINSLAASRENLDLFIELVSSYDTLAIVMSSEKFSEDGGSAQCLNPQDAYQAAKYFVDILRTKAGRSNEQIIIDPGLAPVGADTYGLVNIGLDAMRLIRKDPDLYGTHISVGLTNFSWGLPKHLRGSFENAYLALAVEAGLDFMLANPEKEPHPFAKEDNWTTGLKNALEKGRASDGESQEEAGFCQAEAIMELCVGERDE